MSAFTAIVVVVIVLVEVIVVVVVAKIFADCMGARRFVHNTIRTPDVSYTNHKNCNVSYTSFVKYRIHVYVAIVNEIVC